MLSLGDLVTLGFNTMALDTFSKLNDSHILISSLNLSLELQCEYPTWNSTFPLGYLIDISN